MREQSQRYRLPSWLDQETSALIGEMIDLLASRYPELLAVILYGSVARHEERAIEAPDSSDVDLLAVFDRDELNLTGREREAFFLTLSPAYSHHLEAPRDIQFMLASRTLQEWDPTFVANVRRDGVILYQRGVLPMSLTA